MKHRRYSRSPTALSPCAGYAYLGLLAIIVLCGLALATVSVVWTTATQREREEELLFVGQQFRTASARIVCRAS